jgi:hypothetical protein
VTNRAFMCSEAAPARSKLCDSETDPIPSRYLRMPTKVSLIGVPYMADADGPKDGPEQLIRATQASPAELDIDVSEVERQGPFRTAPARRWRSAGP